MRTTAMAVIGEGASIALQAWLAASGALGLSGDTASVGAIWLAMTATVAIAVAIGSVGLRQSSRRRTSGAVLIVIGAVAAYAWPVITAVGSPPPDFLDKWIQGPALPVWEGLAILVVGVVLAIRKSSPSVTVDPAEGAG
ncbi:MAG: hypothetical protein HY263_08845 [Chloroflexi bacterium]|nr:hypothetical protein [Chloroflexota bacterium]